MGPTDLAALTFVAYLGSGGSKRILGILLLILGLLVAGGPLAPTYKAGYTSTTVQIDENTTQTTLTYTYQPYPDYLAQGFGIAMMLVGLYLFIAPSVGEEDDEIELI